MRSGLLSLLACIAILGIATAGSSALPLHTEIVPARAAGITPGAHGSPISVLRLPRLALFDAAISERRAVLLGTQGHERAQRFLVYDLQSTRLLRRIAIPAALAASLPDALHTVDEARHHAYFLYGNRQHSATILWAIDLNSGRVAFRRTLVGGVPVGPPAIGADGTTLCYQEYSAGHGYHIMIVPLRRRGEIRRAGLGLQPNLLDLFVDSRAHLAIAVSWVGFGIGIPIRVASYNLSSGKLVWQRTRAFRIFPRQTYFNARTELLYITDLAMLSIIHTTDGHTNVAVYGDQGSVLGSLLPVPGSGLYLSWSTPSMLRIDLITPGKPFHVTAEHLASHQFLSLWKEDAAAGITSTLIALQRTPRGLLGYYLGNATTQSGQASLTSTSVLTLFDWRDGRILSRQRLPATGIMWSQEVGHSTMVIVLDTGTRSGLQGTTLLVVGLGTGWRNTHSPKLEAIKSPIASRASAASSPSA